MTPLLLFLYVLAVGLALVVVALVGAVAYLLFHGAMGSLAESASETQGAGR